MEQYAARTDPPGCPGRNEASMEFEENRRMDDKRRQLLQAGVRMMDPAAVYVEDAVAVGAGTLLLPGTILRGNTVVG